MGKEGFVSRVESFSKKLGYAEAGAAGILYVVGSTGWAGVLAIAAAIDLGIAKVLEKLGGKKRSAQYAH